MSDVSGEGTATAQVKRRKRGPNQGRDTAVWGVDFYNERVIEATQALLQARALRGDAVRHALAEGWSVRGLAQALGVDKSWVQRAMGQD